AGRIGGFEAALSPRAAVAAICATAARGVAAAGGHASVVAVARGGDQFGRGLRSGGQLFLVIGGVVFVGLHAADIFDFELGFDDGGLFGRHAELGPFELAGFDGGVARAGFVFELFLDEAEGFDFDGHVTGVGFDVDVGDGDGVGVVFVGDELFGTGWDGGLLRYGVVGGCGGVGGRDFGKTFGRRRGV